MHLAPVTHVDRAREGHLVLAEAGRAQLLDEAPGHAREDCVHLAHVRRRVHGLRHQFVVNHIGGRDAEGAVNRSRVRHDDRAHAEPPAYGRQVHPGGASGGEERKPARIEPALHRGLVQQVVDAAVGEAVDRRRGRFRVHTERSRHLGRESLARRFHVERGRPVQEKRAVQVAQDGVDVSQGRIGAAVVIADRTGIGAGAARPEPRLARRRVHRHDAAAGKAQADDVQLGQRIVIAQHHGLALVVEQALLHRADLEGRAAHVGGDDVGLADALAECFRADQAPYRSGLEQAHRSRGRGGGGSEAPVRLHYEERATAAGVAQPLLEFREVGRYHRPQRHVQRHGRGALVLAQHRSDFVRSGDEDAGPQLAHVAQHRLFVRRVDERPE